MDPSPLYVELETMIEKNWVVRSLPEFGLQLEQLEKDGKISPQEHIRLLNLYLGKPQQAD